MAKEKTVKGLYTQFNKTELVEAAKGLDLTIDPQQMSNRQISKAIIEDLDANGVPEVEDCSDMLLEILHVAEYIDEHGELLEEVDEESEETEPIVETQVEVLEEVPVCYSFADERDPACNKCRVKAECLQARIINRPPCFGKFFDENSIECQGCMEAANCQPLSLQEN
jgi:hypothetical protein